MRVKRFNNLWTMGLILFGVILLSLYFIKLVYPEYVIGVSKNERLMNFGNKIESNIFYYYIFNYSVSMIVGYFYTCACCRKKSLTKLQFFIYALTTALIFVLQKYAYEYFYIVNSLYLLVLPCVFCKIDGRDDIKYLYSTILVYVIHTMAQMLSLEIRDISTSIAHCSETVFTVLVIDVHIWIFLLYNYFNFKGVKENG